MTKTTPILTARPQLESNLTGLFLIRDIMCHSNFNYKADDIICFGGSGYLSLGLARLTKVLALKLNKFFLPKYIQTPLTFKI